jgi:hypothetical protein
MILTTPKGIALLQRLRGEGAGAEARRNARLGEGRRVENQLVELLRSRVGAMTR